MLKSPHPMKQIHFEISTDLYAELVRLYSGYGARSELIRRLLREHVEAQAQQQPTRDRDAA